MASLMRAGLVLVMCIGIGVASSPCSPQNRTDNFTACKTEMIKTMYNADRFWFGNGYDTACPNGSATSFVCQNPKPTEYHSLGTRLLPATYNPDVFTKFVEVKFTSDPGQYTGCGNTFDITETTRFDLDPTSSQIVRPWFVRHTPEMTWNSTPGEYYSLYVYDVGYYITHAVYINIQGNEIPTSGENVIDQYNGPLITTNLENPYAFLLFKQDDYLNPAAAREWYNTTHSPTTPTASNHVTDFITLLNMTGPIGMNWMVATGDEYAAYTMYSRQYTSTCPIFIGQALDNKTRPFLPNPASLSVKMDVTFDVTELSYSACCKDYTESARTFTLNPIGNELLPSASTRSGLAQTITFEKLGFYSMAKNFTGDMYTMIALDPDVPNTAVGTESRPLLHQMKINIVNGDFMTGEEVFSWNGPFPPNDEPHYYYFLLYKHAQTVTRQNMTSYAGNCAAGVAGRCLYDINKAVRENSFTLVGANWFRSVRDPYVRYRNIQSNPNNTQAQCEGQPGYTVNCITSDGPQFSVNGFAMIVFTFVCMAFSMN